MKAVIILLIIGISIGLVSVNADLGYKNDKLPKLKAPTPATITFNNNTGSVNSSDFWDNLDTPADISGLDLADANFGIEIIYGGSLVLSGGNIINDGALNIYTLNSDGVNFPNDGINVNGTVSGNALASAFTNTNSITAMTGDHIQVNDALNVTGYVNATVFNGDGSGLTGVVKGNIFDQDLNTTSNVVFNNVSVSERIGVNTASPEYPFHLIMESTDSAGFFIDGYSNDYSGTGTSEAYAFRLNRDTLVNNAEPDKFFLANFQMNMKHNDAYPITDEKSMQGLYMEFYDYADWVQPTATPTDLRFTGFNSNINTGGGYYMLNSTGKFWVHTVANNIKIFDNADYEDLGSGTLRNYNYGNYIYVDSRPNLVSGTLTTYLYGDAIFLRGSTTGTSYAYGMVISSMDSYAPDNRYGIWTDIGGGNEIVIDRDDGMLRFGETQGDFDIDFDGTQPRFEWSDITQPAWFEGNVSATGYITRTSVFDKERGSALDLIKDADDYKAGNEINHSAFYGATQYEVTDYSNCWEVLDKYCWNETRYETNEHKNLTGYKLGENNTIIPIYEYYNITILIEGEICHEENIDNTPYDWVTYRQECGTKIEHGVVLDEEINVLRQAVYELKQENELLKARLDKLE